MREPSFLCPNPPSFSTSAALTAEDLERSGVSDQCFMDRKWWYSPANAGLNRAHIGRMMLAGFRTNAVTSPTAGPERAGPATSLGAPQAAATAVELPSAAVPVSHKAVEAAGSRALGADVGAPRARVVCSKACMAALEQRIAGLDRRKT